MSVRDKLNSQDPKKLPQYKGRLDAVGVAAGMNAARKNANRLLVSAKVLFDNGDYASAVSLAVLAVEEAGKVSILRGIALTTDEEQLKKLWKNYRSHTEKTRLWDIANYIGRGKIKLEDFRDLFSPDNASSKILDQIKQVGFYTDCFGHAHWSIPAEIIDKSFAEHILQMASSHCKTGKEISVKEIELWIECLSPVWMKSMEEMKQGLVTWRKKMLEAGLTDGQDKFIEFITTGVNFL